jgi:hypothetical protein
MTRSQLRAGPGNISSRRATHGSGVYRAGAVARRLISCALALALAASCSSAKKADNAAPTTTVAPSTTTARRHTPVRGGWVNSTPAVSLGASVRGIKQRSGTTWNGDLAGTTSYVAYTRSDPKHPGVLIATIDEVFTGSLRGVGHGRLFLGERMTVAAKGGAMRNVATIKRGDGDLAGATGTIVFLGKLDTNADGSVAVSGLGHGTYTGTIARRAL